MGCCSSTEVESPRQQQYSRTIRTTTQTSQVQKSQESTQQAITSQGTNDWQFPSISFKEAKAARAANEEKGKAEIEEPPPSYEDSEAISLNEDPLKNTCTICNCVMTDHEQVLPLGCGHIFHTACVKPYMMAKPPTCPRCKAQFYIPGPDGQIPPEVERQMNQQQAQQQQPQQGVNGGTQHVTINNYNSRGPGMMPMMMMPMLMPMFLPRMRPVVVVRPRPIVRPGGYGPRGGPRYGSRPPGRRPPGAYGRPPGAYRGGRGGFRGGGGFGGRRR